MIFAYHGYPWLIHRLTYRRTGHTQHPRARLQGGGHDDDAVRHGHAQRPRPVPPGDRRHRQRAVARQRAGRACARRWSTRGSAPASTPASTATTCPRCATGCGPTPQDAVGRRARSTATLVDRRRQRVAPLVRGAGAAARPTVTARPHRRRPPWPAASTSPPPRATPASPRSRSAWSTCWPARSSGSGCSARSPGPTDVRDYVLELLLAARRRRPHVRRVRRGDVRAGARTTPRPRSRRSCPGTTTSSGAATPSWSSAPTTPTSPGPPSWRTTPASPRTSARRWCSSSTAATARPAVVAQVADVVVTEMHGQPRAGGRRRRQPVRARRSVERRPRRPAARHRAARRGRCPRTRCSTAPTVRQLVGGRATARSSPGDEDAARRARCSTSSSAPCRSSTCWTG